MSRLIRLAYKPQAVTTNSHCLCLRVFAQSNQNAAGTFGGWQATAAVAAGCVAHGLRAGTGCRGIGGTVGRVAAGGIYPLRNHRNPGRQAATRQGGSFLSRRCHASDRLDIACASYRTHSMELGAGGEPCWGGAPREVLQLIFASLPLKER